MNHPSRPPDATEPLRRGCSRSQMSGRVGHRGRPRPGRVWRPRRNRRRALHHRVRGRCRGRPWTSCVPTSTSRAACWRPRSRPSAVTATTSPAWRLLAVHGRHRGRTHRVVLRADRVHTPRRRTRIRRARGAGHDPRSMSRSQTCSAAPAAPSGATHVPGVRCGMAANHWQLAVDTHNTNHPDADHDCADISQVDPRRYPRTDLLWASPECTNHSQAKGTQAQSTPQPDLFGDDPCRTRPPSGPGRRCGTSCGSPSTTATARSSSRTSSTSRTGPTTAARRVCCSGRG